jgi:hypothetical protein
MTTVDRYTKVLLTIIAVVRWALVARPVWTPTPVGAQGGGPCGGSASTACFVRTSVASGPLAVEVDGR